jgi:hypothetical protein
MKIFVSYTLRDRILNISKLRKMESLLSQFGTPYIDLLHNKSLTPQTYVISMLEQSSVLCAYLTPGFLESEWVQLELELAYKNQIPVLWVTPSLQQWLTKMVYSQCLKSLRPFKNFSGSEFSVDRVWRVDRKPALARSSCADKISQHTLVFGGWAAEAVSREDDTPSHS